MYIKDKFIVSVNNLKYLLILQWLNLVCNFRCEKEYLEFRDGAARFSKLINHICGRNQVQDIETTGNFLYIKFFTDLSVPNNGFKLNVTIGTY